MRWLLESLDHETDADVADVVKIAVFTGARRGNILGMRWDEIDLVQQEWRIGRTKNGEAQTLPISSAAMPILERRQVLHGAGDWVFPGGGKTGHLVEPKKAWLRILQRASALRLRLVLARAGELDEPQFATSYQECCEFLAHALEKLLAIAADCDIPVQKLSMLDLRMHDLRRTVGSWMASSGASLPLIGKVLNHKTSQATQVYARFMLDPIREALEQVANDVNRTRV
jgi:integrase